MEEICYDIIPVTVPTLVTYDRIAIPDKQKGNYPLSPRNSTTPRIAITMVKDKNTVIEYTALLSQP